MQHPHTPSRYDCFIQKVQRKDGVLYLDTKRVLLCDPFLSGQPGYKSFIWVEGLRLFCTASCCSLPSIEQAI